jgi:uncharacterized protein YggE
MPSHLLPRAALAGAALALAAAAPASAQLPVPVPGRTIVSTGAGSVKPVPQDRNDNASIAAAVKAAYAAALPKAVAEARDDAADLASAAGVTLGELVSVSNAPAQPFYGPFFGGEIGTFGPGRFCGNVRTPIVKRDKLGRRHVIRFRTRHTCRVPGTITRSVTLTFAIA